MQDPNQPPPPDLGTGDVQVTLAWSDGADLDLHVVDPRGEEIWYGNTASASGGRLDHDTIPPCGDNARHYENIFRPTGAPARQYSVVIRVVPRGAAPPATPSSPLRSAARSCGASRSRCPATAAAPP
ncbi:MAG: hypothetical protein IPM45_17695 [Acidimicrobiales bacterium]|nr:hypothetical protein [Acidimicrobiales bacterium]